MSLSSIPIELVKKIFYYLINDGQAFVSLASTCRLFNQLANEFQLTSAWREFRPITFHAVRAICYKDWGCKCKEPNICDSRFTFTPNFVTIRSYVIPFQFLINCKHRKFSTIRFESALMQKLICFDGYIEGRENVPIRSIDSIVEVELVNFAMTFEWLQQVLDHLPNVSHLALADMKDGGMGHPEEMEYKESWGKRKLESLKLNDVSRLAINAYSEEIHVYSLRRRHQLSVMAVLPYVKRCQPTLKHLIMNETNIEPSGVKRILRDDDLKNLRLTVRNCYALGGRNQTALIEELYDSELSRVTF